MAKFVSTCICRRVCHVMYKYVPVDRNEWNSSPPTSRNQSKITSSIKFCILNDKLDTTWYLLILWIARVQNPLSSFEYIHLCNDYMKIENLNLQHPIVFCNHYYCCYFQYYYFLAIIITIFICMSFLLMLLLQNATCQTAELFSLVLLTLMTIHLFSSNHHTLDVSICSSCTLWKVSLHSLIFLSSFIEISTATPTGTIVLNVTASDIDTGAFGTVSILHINRWTHATFVYMVVLHWYGEDRIRNGTNKFICN